MAISIYANAFAADAQVASDIASRIQICLSDSNSEPARAGDAVVLLQAGVKRSLPLVRLSRKSRHSKTAELSFRATAEISRKFVHSPLET